MPQKETFSIDARTVLSLGRQSIRDHTTAVLELVKNSYDADATTVIISVIGKAPVPLIRISDNGEGMTAQDIRKKWLRIGYSAKRENTTTERRRRRTGEKGIGRISADRLGAALVLRTRGRGQNAVQLEVNWNDFDVAGKDLTEIPVTLSEVASPLFPEKSAHGTELTISSLREHWTSKDVEALYQELSLLTPPFRAVDDFSIYIESDIEGAPTGRVNSPFFEVAEIELTAKLRGLRVDYSIKDRIGTTELEERVNHKTTWQRLSHQSATRPERPRIGPIAVRLAFYPRKAALLKGTEFRLTDLREFLGVNAGVKVYRDNVRVKPYGDPSAPEGDWLGLAERKTRDPAGVARAGFRVAPNQIVGAVFISRDENPELVDSASREGLIENEAFIDLRRFVIACLRLLESHRHEVYAQQPERSASTSPKAEIKDLQQELKLLRKDLSGIRQHVPKASTRFVDRAIDQVAAVGERIESAAASLEEILSQAGVLRGLATVGIANSVFGHETQSALAGFVQSTYLASEVLADTPPDIPVALRELQKAKEFAAQVEGWGNFALMRVRRDKRKKRIVNLDLIAEDVVAALMTPFMSASIDIMPDVDPVKARAFPMDVEAVLINLLTNAYVACLQTRRARIIRLRIKGRKSGGREGILITVADSGPGVDEAFVERIWKPLFTTRQDSKGRDTGTGLGLTIVQGIIDENHGWRAVDRDPELRGARFQVWLPA